MENKHSKNYRQTWEDYHGIKIPEGWEIHHWKHQADGGNHCINNLVACPRKAHDKFHDGGLTNWMDSLREYRGTGKATLKAEYRTDNQKAANKAIAEINKGRTKETHESVARMAKKQKGKYVGDNNYQRQPGYSHSEDRVAGFESASKKMSVKMKGSGNSNADHTKYWWVHKDGTNVIATRVEMNERFNTSTMELSRLMVSRIGGSHKGWKLKGINNEKQKNTKRGNT